MDSANSNPYVGPRPFEKQEGHLFFGREREASKLLYLVIAERLVLFYALSGAGKTSLINTCLIPGLEDEGFEVLPVGRVSGVEQPYGDIDNIFTYNLILRLSPQAEDFTRFTQMPLAKFLNYLVTGENGFYYDESFLPTEILPRILIIDQFEELFTAYPGAWKKQADFFIQLRAAMEADPYLSVVLAMREDYVARLDPYADLVPGKLRDRFFMQRMGKEAARKAIMRPAYDAGRPFEEETALSLVENLSQIRTQVPSQEVISTEGQFVEPVQLQVVCHQIWESLKGTPPKTIASRDLRRLAEGGDLQKFIDDSLGEFYKGAIGQVLAQPDLQVSELELRKWFDEQLITEANTRGIVHRGPEKTGGLDNKVVEELDVLLRAETRAGGTWYELAHDRFIEPIQKANRDWWLGQMQNPIRQAAQEWDQQGRNQYQLYVGLQLERALANVNLETSEPVVVEFLEASKRTNLVLEEEARVQKNFNTMVSLGALLVGAAIGSFLPILLVSLWILANFLSASEVVLTEDIASFILILGIMALSAMLGGALGWLVIRGGYDWMRSRAASRNHLRIIRAKLQSQG